MWLTVLQIGPRILSVKGSKSVSQSEPLCSVYGMLSSLPEQLCNAGHQDSSHHASCMRCHLPGSSTHRQPSCSLHDMPSVTLFNTLLADAVFWCRLSVTLFNTLSAKAGFCCRPSVTLFSTLSANAVFWCRPSRVYGQPGPMNMNKQFAILFKMGTLEETKDRAWSWVMSAPIDAVKAAGVDFDPNARSIKSVQGDAGGQSSAFEVSCLHRVHEGTAG